MRKTKFILIIMVCLIALIGCSKDKNVMGNQYTLEDVISVFGSQNLKLASFGILGTSLSLNKTMPEVNSIETEAVVDQSEPELVYLYIFKTEQARNTGVKEFNKKMKHPKYTTYPFLYEKGNVLVIYWAKSKDSPLMDKSIQMAIEKL
ncbi:hypothetical protein BVG16_21025 [Paenibacillus selenitireducens]|uniref:DUF4358 domain-containing protein n=2 Tax=Paenibacillus selenitireducens TaxID=1324314 RepID=A0A1T2X5E7_9BACL|nr:hypothetical protein BVG16_21025 [Paenibacillus selenitireducens]